MAYPLPFSSVSQLVVLLAIGRGMGELMQRIGQPPVIGQIIAGVLLGPSVLGALAPRPAPALFPGAPDQKAMLDAVAQLGIFLLLLLTGMETDLSVFREARRPAISISLAGSSCRLPAGRRGGTCSCRPRCCRAPAKRLITALFLGTALSISSVKIVALVVRELGFLRRTVGQVIIAAAILDDTIGWIIMSVIFGLALTRQGRYRHRQPEPCSAPRCSSACAFTVGRRVVFQLIRWSNDHLKSELAADHR